MYPLPPTNSSQFQVTLEHEGIRSHRHRGQHRSGRRHGRIRGGATAWGWNEGDASQEAQGLRWQYKPPNGWVFLEGGLKIFFLSTVILVGGVFFGGEVFLCILDVFGSDGHFNVGLKCPKMPFTG